MLFIKPCLKHHNWIHGLQSYHLSHQFGVDVHLHVDDKTKYSHLAQCISFKQSIGVTAKFIYTSKKGKCYTWLVKNLASNDHSFIVQSSPCFFPSHEEY